MERFKGGRKMIEKLQHKFALSPKGARDLIKGIAACAVQNITFMLPVCLLFYFVKDLLSGSLEMDRIVFYCAGIVLSLALIFVVTLFQYNSTFLATYVETGTRRITLAEKLRKIPLSFFAKKDLADLTSTIMDDCTYLETAFSHFIPQFVGSLISTVLVALGLFAFNFKMALAALWVLPVSFAIVGFSSRVQRSLGKRSLKAKLDCADGIQECIECVCDIKSNNAADKYLEGLDRKIDAVEKTAIVGELGTAAFVSTAQMILKLGIATTALVGSSLLVKGSIDVLTFFMFLLVVSRIYDPMQASLQNLAAIISTKNHVERMNEILDCEIRNGETTLKNNGTDIVFDNVTFSYEKGEWVLSGVSFAAKQKEVTAIVGPSGGGKTTVSRLAARFWDPDGGKITVGGQDITEVEPETLLKLFSIVFQDVTLFNGSVKDNIKIGKRGATDEEILRAARLAGCDEFVMKLKNGYDTNIGENGCRLSGGERQRISIARAFLKDAPIILLDEATASLDVENETLVQSALSRLIKDKTVLIIAHRMRTVSGADKIVVLENGKVTAQGTPRQLLESDGFFKRALESQTESLKWKI